MGLNRSWVRGRSIGKATSLRPRDCLRLMLNQNNRRPPSSCLLSQSGEHRVTGNPGVLLGEGRPCHGAALRCSPEGRPGAERVLAEKRPRQIGSTLITRHLKRRWRPLHGGPHTHHERQLSVASDQINVNPP